GSSRRAATSSPGRGISREGRVTATLDRGEVMREFRPAPERKSTADLQEAGTRGKPGGDADPAERTRREADLTATGARVAIEGERRVGQAGLGLHLVPRRPVPRDLDPRPFHPRRVAHLDADAAD